MGQSEVFEEASHLLDEIGGISISGMQIQRVCLHYGGLLDPLLKANCEAVIPRLEAAHETDPLYTMVDGAMIFTRPDEWREIKLGRLFFGSSTVDLSKKGAKPYVPYT